MNSRLRLGGALMALAGLGFVAYAGIFLAMNFTDSFLELGIGPEQVDVSREEIREFSPDLYHYISHVQIAAGGFIAAVGLAVIALSWFGVRAAQGWAWVAAVVVPVVGLAIALPAHYPWGFDTIGHLGLVYADTILLVVGAAIAGAALRTAKA